MPVFRFILSWWGVFLQCLPRVPASLSCSLQTSAFVVASVQPPLTSKIFLTWGAAVHRLRLSHTVIKLKSWKYAFLVCFLIPFHPTRVPGFSPLMLIICTKNKTSLHSGYSLTYFSQTSNCFDIRKKRDSPVSLYSKITCGLLSVKTRKTQYSRATHDPWPTTQNARPMTHYPRPTYPRDSAILKWGVDKTRNMEHPGTWKN